MTMEWDDLVDAATGLVCDLLLDGIEWLTIAEALPDASDEELKQVHALVGEMLTRLHEELHNMDTYQP